MAGEHYRYIQDQIDFAASHRREEGAGADEEARAGVISEIHAILTDYKNNAPEVTQYPQSLVEVKKEYDRRLNRYVVRIRLLYGKKLSLSPEEIALINNNQYQSTGDTSLPAEIVKYDYHRTPFITIHDAIVEVAHRPMGVLDERRKVWFDMGHEFYEIRDIADNPSIMYPAFSRFVRDTTHTREYFLRGRDYLKPPPGPKGSPSIRN